MHIRKAALIGQLAVLAVLWLAGCGSDKNGPGHDIPEIVDYNRHIRPILSSNCYVCHGPDISSREAGLRLDLRDSAMVALESGEKAIIPGNSAESALIRRVSSSDPEERMPPAEMKKVLSPEEVATLARWIDQGAEWKPHWSLVPPERIEPTNQFGRTTIDAYVENGVEKKRLETWPTCRQTPADSPAFICTHRITALFRRRRGVSKPERPRCLRTTGRSTARFPSLWRTLGQALDGCGPICRHQGP